MAHSYFLVLSRRLASLSTDGTLTVFGSLALLGTLTKRGSLAFDGTLVAYGYEAHVRL